MWGKKHKRIGVVLTCADWRLHKRKVDLNYRLAKLLGVDGVDLIALPGPDGLLKPDRVAEWEAALGQVKLLMGAHSPRALAIVAHQRCAGHPVSDAEHDADAREMAKKLKAWTGFEGPVRAVVLVYNSDTSWELKQLAQF